MQAKNDRIKAVFATDAVCRGSGSDRYKWVSGLTRRVIVALRDAGVPSDAPILVHSHTRYGGQYFKLAVKRNGRWTHRQICDRDYRLGWIVTRTEVEELPL